jgi:hypothetical protein
MKMQGSKTDSFVKTAQKQRRYDDGVTKQGNAKKGKFSPKRTKERSEYDH